MKKILMSLAACCLIIEVSHAQLKTPAATPGQTIKQDFALSSVELSYSRPGIKGRKIFGDLVPYGKVWRTGANKATTIEFGEDVMFGGKNVPAGKYGLLTIPGATEWTVILSKQLDVTAPAAYKEDMDLVRVNVKPMKMPMGIESFTLGFGDVKANSMMLYLLWDKTYLEVPVTANIDTKIMSQIDEQMNGNGEKKPYFQAAAYYLENGKDLNKALSWFDKAVEENPDAFFMHYQRARCLAKLGRKQEALAASQKSMELAKKAKSDDYVALNEKLITSLK
jgi:hypothetical protein